MNKYYDKEIPTEIHFIYGGRYSGKTYKEFEKLKTRIKELEKENKYLKNRNHTLMNYNYNAANYILNNCMSEETGCINNGDIVEIYKALSGGGIVKIKKEVNKNE